MTEHDQFYDEQEIAELFRNLPRAAKLAIEIAIEYDQAHLGSGSDLLLVHVLEDMVRGEWMV